MPKQTKMLTFAEWVEREARPKDLEILEGSPTQQMMLRFWETHRPKMFKYLKEQGLHKKLAKVLENKAHDQAWSLRHQMPMTDAQEQAERDWYMMEEEDPESDPERDFECARR